MLTRYILHIDGEDYTLREDDLRNWDAVKCSRTRSDYGGVVRSFTSKFEFVNEARRKLLALYLRDGFNAKASVSVETLTNSWTYEKRFECHLDFSTIQWEDCVLMINAVDNSIAALIKANKSTKYEFLVGKDITPDSVMVFDRVPMKESLTYEFTQGEQLDDGAIRATFEKDLLPYMGVVEKEVSINRAINWNEDQANPKGSYLLKAESDVVVDLQYELEYRERSSSLCYFYIKIRRRGSVIDVGTINLATRTISHWSQPCDSPADLPDASGLLDNTFSQVGDYLWVVKDGEWVNVGKTNADEYFLLYASGEVTLELVAGDVVYIDHASTSPVDSYIVTFNKSKFTFSWIASGPDVLIDVMTPQTVAEALLAKITEGSLDASVIISDFDTRLSKTYLMAAESIRGIEAARLYTSFNDFCDWMSAVFGFVYAIDGTAVRFLHRSELFDANASVQRIAEPTDVRYFVESGSIYSSVTAGYDRKDYNSINGRDEFNFSNTYSTGCSVTDKTLSLISKYRADSYGIEFAVQKRGEDTTDSSSDKDVFFILCKSSSDKLFPDRTAAIANAVSGRLFNAAFCPMACVRANAGLIGLQSPELELKFASSTANSDIVIDGEPMTADITLDTPLATCGVVEFSTYEDITDAMEERIISVRSAGLTYEGFLMSADTCFARKETAKCKLIVKEVLP